MGPHSWPGTGTQFLGSASSQKQPGSPDLLLSFSELLASANTPELTRTFQTWPRRRRITTRNGGLHQENYLYDCLFSKYLGSLSKEPIDLTSVPQAQAQSNGLYSLARSAQKGPVTRSGPTSVQEECCSDMSSTPSRCSLNGRFDSVTA